MRRRPRNTEEAPSKQHRHGYHKPPLQLNRRDWGLRDYGEETRAIYGGNPSCQHEWLTSNHPNLNAQYATCRKCSAYYGQLGLEPHPQTYIDHIVEVMREIKRILKPEGSLYLNIGDTYAGSRLAKTEKHGWLQPKQRLLIPERIAVKMQEEGWILRNTIVWFKPVHMPESVKDRFTKSWEPIFFFVKQPKYYFNINAVREPSKPESLERWGRALKQKENGNIKLVKKKLKSTNVTVSTMVPKWFEENPPNIGVSTSKPKDKNPGDTVNLTKHDLAVGRIGSFTTPLHTKEYHPLGKNPGDHWGVSTKPFPEAHFAVFPPELCLRPILASCPPYVCKKCGKPKRETIIVGGTPHAFNIRVRDAKLRPEKWGVLYSASKAEKESCNKKNYTSPLKEKTTSEGCNCSDGYEPGIVLDPFCGSGTALIVAKALGRRFIGIDIKKNYVDMSLRRLAKINPPLFPITNISDGLKAVKNI